MDRLDSLLARVLRLPADLVTCVSFFTRIPVRSAVSADFNMRVSAAAWPLLGGLLGAGGSLVLWIGVAGGLSPTVAAVLAIAFLVTLSGALHEDGLADTADGLGGGSTPETRRAIMRDSRLGTFGALALVLTMLARVAAVAALAPAPGKAAIALMIAGIVSRALAIWHWHSLPAAWDNGLARMAGQPDRTTYTLAGGIGGLAALLAVATLGSPALLGCALAATSLWLFTRLCRHHIGGHSGDTIGAAQQIAETLLLVGFSANLHPVLG